MLLTVERVIILRSVAMFAETPDPILAAVASSMVEVEARAGDQIIKQDELGTSMYVIVSGRVRVHIGEQTLATLGDREVIGELAALDPEPRSASVTALEDTRLLRLEHDVLLELLTERVDVARGIIRSLCRRLRVASRTSVSQAKG